RLEQEVGLLDGRRLGAELAGRDVKTGLALLEVKSDIGREFSPFSFAGKEVQMGDRVFVGGQVTEAILAPGESDFVTVHVQDGRQMDGPVINGDGVVIGILMAYLRSKDGNPATIGYAVPGKVAARIAEELRTKGRVERTWAGLLTRS